jgi:hypothetical protein
VEGFGEGGSAVGLGSKERAVAARLGGFFLPPVWKIFSAPFFRLYFPFF